MKIDLNNKKFISVHNSANGEVGSETTFFYKQSEDIIHADYHGGDIVKGQLVGRVLCDEYFDFVYQHINTKKELMTGKCRSYPEIGENGEIILKEVWQWTCKDNSCGESTLKEI